MYREGKPFEDLIPPDRRRQKLLLTITLSMMAGAGLCLGVTHLLSRVEASERPVKPSPVSGHIQPSVLSGADGELVMPPRGPAIVNVWLQGCQDCMPAFEAMQRLRDEGGLGVNVPVYNVAYGEADPVWATRYGVRENLAYDLGGASVVRPLGIHSFTTLVIDRDGTIILRDRPDQAGYRARIRAAVHADDHLEPGVRATLDPAAVEDVVASQRAAVKRTCWEPASLSHASITVRAVVGADGRVTSTNIDTDEKAGVASCIESEVRKWRFPAAPDRADVAVNIPFKFVRQ